MAISGALLHAPTNPVAGTTPSETVPVKRCVQQLCSALADLLGDLDAVPSTGEPTPYHSEQIALDDQRIATATAAAAAPEDLAGRDLRRRSGGRP